MSLRRKFIYAFIMLFSGSSFSLNVTAGNTFGHRGDPKQKTDLFRSISRMSHDQQVSIYNFLDASDLLNCIEQSKECANLLKKTEFRPLRNLWEIGMYANRMKAFKSLTALNKDLLNLRSVLISAESQLKDDTLKREFRLKVAPLMDSIAHLIIEKIKEEPTSKRERKRAILQNLFQLTKLSDDLKETIHQLNRQMELEEERRLEEISEMSNACLSFTNAAVGLDVHYIPNFFTTGA